MRCPPLTVPAAATVMAVCAVACGGGDSPGSPVTRHDSAGIEIVDYVLRVERDELEVEYVVLFDLVSETPQGPS